MRWVAQNRHGQVWNATHFQRKSQKFGHPLNEKGDKNSQNSLPDMLIAVLTCHPLYSKILAIKKARRLQSYATHFNTNMTHKRYINIIFLNVKVINGIYMFLFYNEMHCIPDDQKKILHPKFF